MPHLKHWCKGNKKQTFMQKLLSHRCTENITDNNVLEFVNQLNVKFKTRQSDSTFQIEMEDNKGCNFSYGFVKSNLKFIIQHFNYKFLNGKYQALFTQAISAAGSVVLNFLALFTQAISTTWQLPQHGTK